MHFSSNNAPQAATDRAWKPRPVITALQDNFQRSFIPPPVMAFDEAMLPSRSAFNRMRVYMKDKPHKWGTKLFMLCCSQTAYFIRFEVYCGKRQMQVDSTPPDEKSGPAAVAGCNRSVLYLRGARNATTYDVCLHRWNDYEEQASLCEAILPPKLKNGRRASNKRPAHIERGTYEVATSVHIPAVKAIRWYDNQGVHVLATGGSAQQDRIVRRDPITTTEVEVMAPRAVKDYQTFMGGVDVHDLLRLQRHSLQLARRYRKYYKSLFLGLIDMAIINAFIVFNCRWTRDGERKLSHVQYLKQLHLELSQLQAEDWQQLLRHRGFQTDEWRKGSATQARKRRQRACKVCSVSKADGEARGGETTFFCGECKLKPASKNALAARVFLCNKVKHSVNSVSASCFEIWHTYWENGTLIPQTRNKRKIRARKPKRSTGENGGDADSSEQSGGESGSDSSPHQKRSSGNDDAI
ncbi:hypothetical protein PC111_g3317 [Phytophthora cactorum]|nr:hypothetical protein PC111_g3317 [Phytophthora cactorum]KAG2949910.1 hypothetical protein PC117_g4862 [Phytophthora cactorum]